MQLIQTGSVLLLLPLSSVLRLPLYEDTANGRAAKHQLYSFAIDVWFGANGAVCSSLVQSVVVQCSLMWCSSRAVWFSLVWCGMLHYVSLVKCSVVWYAPVGQSGVVWCGAVQCGGVRVAER